MKRDKMSAGSKFLAEICLDWSKAKSEIADFWMLFSEEGRTNIFMYILNVKLQENLPSTLNITGRILKLTASNEMPDILGRQTIAMNFDGSKMFIENICKRKAGILGVYKHLLSLYLFSLC
jgi:hypothetical protein